jgi:plastocyanin
MKIRSTIAALAAGALVTAATALTAPVASAASPPQQKTMKLSDNCDRPSWEATPGFQGACNVDAGGVTPDRFNADLPEGGNNNWWINNREETIKEGDSLFVDNVGGEVHTFTRVDQFGQGVVPPFNAAVPNDPPASGGEIVANPDGTPSFGTVVATAVAPDADHGGFFNSPPSRTVSGLKAGTYKFQCLFHPWMRTTVTVLPNT